MFQQIIKQWFWDQYDHLGRLLAANVVLFMVTMVAVVYTLAALSYLGEGAPPGFRALAIAVALVVVPPVLLALWFGSVSHFAGYVSDEKDPGFRVFMAGLARRFFRAWRFFATVCVLFALLGINIWFYTLSGRLQGTLLYVGFALAGICFWLIVMLLISLLASIPVLFRQQRGIFQTIKVGFIALLKYPGLMIGSFAFLASLWIIGVAIKFAGVLLFGFTGTAMLMNSLYDVITELEAAQEDAAKETGDSRPRSWKELRAMEKEGEEDRMKKARYERTLRDVLKPWES